MLFSSAAFHGFSLSLTTNGAGAPLIGLRVVVFLPCLTGRGGGIMASRRSSMITSGPELTS